MRGFIACTGDFGLDWNAIGAKDGKGMKDALKNICAIIT